MFDQLSSSVNAILHRYPSDRITDRGAASSVKSRLRAPITSTERAAAELVARARPAPYRAYDQIPMRTDDLARQAKLIAPLLAGRRVAFVGDMDGTASLLGLLAVADGPVPAGLLVLDFDDRVLETAQSLAERHGFAHLLIARRYNCFDPVPPDLLGCSDWFYVNPPYGSCNRGASARLFLTRGCELVQSQGGSGCLILPDDVLRPWTRFAMIATQQFLHTHGWAIREKLDRLHRYHLDDDPDLSSSLVIVDRVVSGVGPSMPFAGRHVGMDEIPNFYGRNTTPPYPSCISRNGVVIEAASPL